MYFFRMTVKNVLFRFICSFMVFFLLFPLSSENANSTQLKFFDKTLEAGLFYQPSPIFGLSWGDFNDDNLVDMYIRNHENPSSLYVNSGNGVRPMNK